MCSEVVVEHWRALSVMMAFIIRHLLWFIIRCSRERDGPGSADSGAGCTRRGRLHSGEAVCSSHAGFSQSCNGGLDHADPRGPAGPGVPWRCWESAETSAGQIASSDFSTLAFFLVMFCLLWDFDNFLLIQVKWGGKAAFSFLSFFDNFSAFHGLPFTFTPCLVFSPLHVFSLTS